MNRYHLMYYFRSGSSNHSTMAIDSLISSDGIHAFFAGTYRTDYLLLLTSIYCYRLCLRYGSFAAGVRAIVFLAIILRWFASPVGIDLDTLYQYHNHFLIPVAHRHPCDILDPVRHSLSQRNWHSMRIVRDLLDDVTRLHMFYLVSIICHRINRSTNPLRPNR